MIDQRITIMRQKSDRIDKRISVVLMSSFVVLMAQYFVLICFKLMNSPVVGTIQLISKGLVGIIFVTALPQVLKRSLDKFILVYLVAALIFLFHYKLFPENRIFLKGLLFPVFFMSLPSFVYSMSIRNWVVFKGIIRKASYVIFVLGTALSLLIFFGKASAGSYSMALSYYMLLPAIMFLDILFDRFSIKVLLPALVTLMIILAIGSRGAILCIIVFVFLKVIKIGKKLSRKTEKLYFSIGSLVLLCCLFFKQILQIIYNILLGFGIRSRSIMLFLSNEVYLSGRDDLYSRVFDKIMDDPLVGIGIAGDRRLIGGSYVHNFFIEIIGNYGILIGLALSLLLIMIIMKSLATNSKIKYRMITIWLSMGFVHLMISNSYLEDVKFWILMGILVNHNRVNKNGIYLSRNKELYPDSKNEVIERKNSGEEPLVSICCVTYNHEKYIADAIESFLNQETNFTYEIIIHDDASTDRTAEIIKEYEKKYPNIIRAIYQEENQYSKGIKPLRKFVIPLVRGKYMATCEGDDFWTDTKKLQQQVDFLESNSDYIMCFHKVKIVNTDRKFLGRYLGLRTKGSRDITIRDAALGGNVHVSSRLIRTDFNRKPRPDWIGYAKHGDYAFALYTAAEGKVHYIDRVMSAYRIGVEGSLMTKFRSNYSKKKDIMYHNNRIKTLHRADEYYNYEYHDEIELVNLNSYVIIGLLKNDFSDTAKAYYKSYIKEYGLLVFIKLFLLKKLPNLSRVIARIKGSIASKKNR